MRRPHVAKFADISGPAVFAQFPNGLFVKIFFFPAVLRRHLAREVRNQAGKILRAFAQGRPSASGKTLNAVEKVAPKAVLLHKIFQVAIAWQRPRAHSL